MTKLKVMVLGDMDLTDKVEYNKFTENFEVVRYELKTKEKVIEDFKTGILSDVSAILSFWMGFVAVGGLKGELVNALPSSLKIVAAPSVGYDHYDAKALAKKGVVLTNSPGISADAVADIALFLALSTYRFTTVMEYTLREQKHTVKARQSVAALDISTGNPMSEGYPAKFAYGHEVGAKRATSPKGQNVGIAGFGAIGRATGKRLAALGMNVHYFKRRKLSAEEERELGYPATFHATVESLFKSSNLLMLTIPLTQETRHMVNQDSISLLPDGAKIVNVGRGALIDEDALVMALKSGKLSSVGLDVFEKEPAVHPELLSRLDVTLIPHLGGAEAAAAHDAYVHCMKAITNVLLENGNGLTPVN